MGQKINPNIIRLGVFKNWNSKFFELNKEEHTTLNYQNMQIIDFLKKFFKNYKIEIHDIKLGYSNKNLYIYVSYYYTKKFFIFMKKSTSFKLKKKKIKNKLKIKTKKKTVYNKINRYFNKKKIRKIIIYNLKRRSRYRFYFRFKQSKVKFSLKHKRLKIISNYKIFNMKKKIFNKTLLKKNFFINNLLETLTLFTKKKYNIKLLFQHVNKGITLKLTKPEKNELRKKTLLLKQYSRQPFFAEGVSTIITMLYFKKPINSFLNYLSHQLRIQKRHKYFLVFLKRALNNLLTSKFSNTKGIKIIINGRFNKRPRARTESIIIGDVPVQTFDKSIQYEEATAYTRDGTFGIKIWLN